MSTAHRRRIIGEMPGRRNEGLCWRLAAVVIGLFMVNSSCTTSARAGGVSQPLEIIPIGSIPTIGSHKQIPEGSRRPGCGVTPVVTLSAGTDKTAGTNVGVWFKIDASGSPRWTETWQAKATIDSRKQTHEGSRRPGCTVTPVVTLSMRTDKRPGPTTKTGSSSPTRRTAARPAKPPLAHVSKSPRAAGAPGAASPLLSRYQRAPTKRPTPTPEKPVELVGQEREQPPYFRPVSWSE
jgi:hypothetical protein